MVELTVLLGGLFAVQASSLPTDMVHTYSGHYRLLYILSQNVSSALFALDYHNQGASCDFLKNDLPPFVFRLVHLHGIGQSRT